MGSTSETGSATQPAAGPGARWLRWAAVVVLVLMVAVRFLARSPLWLDEAQTVEIARRSLPHLFTALRHDGSPPLYYLLLHAWMAVFGTSNAAVRSLSGLCSVAALPLIWLVARRFPLFGNPAWPAVLLLATSPFAVRYATETRMYSLVLVLVLLALLAYERVWSSGSPRAVVGAALVTGALVLTQYWSLFLVLVVGAGSVVALARGMQAARRVLLSLAIGCLAFVPWLPSFAYQAAHTGAPWGPPPGLDEPLLAVRGWTGGGFAGPLLAAAYYLLLALAVAGYRSATTAGITFRPPLRRTALLLLGVAVAAMTVGVVASDIQSSAYASRYSMIAIAPVVLVAASGVGVLSPRARTIGLCAVCALGLVNVAYMPQRLRTQAGQVATVLEAAAPQDLVVFCPDQLGPAVHRLAPNAGTQVVYPTFGGAAMVDWVDYAQRNRNADPVAFARTALRRAAGHDIWLVYATGYPTLAGGCSSLLTSFTVARGRPADLIPPHRTFEKYAVADFAPR